MPESELTYHTIIGTRYPELDNVQNDIIQFGNYLQAEQCTRGGFLPIFWDAPYSYIQACTDIGEVVDWVAKEERVSEGGSDTDSGWSGVSDNSSTDSECTDMEASSIASDQDRFDTAYEALQDLANDLYYIDLTRYSRGRPARMRQESS